MRKQTNDIYLRECHFKKPPILQHKDAHDINQKRTQQGDCSLDLPRVSAVTCGSRRGAKICARGLNEAHTSHPFLEFMHGAPPTQTQQDFHAVDGLEQPGIEAGHVASPFLVPERFTMLLAPAGPAPATGLLGLAAGAHGSDGGQAQCYQQGAGRLRDGTRIRVGRRTRRKRCTAVGEVAVVVVVA